MDVWSIFFDPLKKIKKRLQHYGATSNHRSIRRSRETSAFPIDFTYHGCLRNHKNLALVLEGFFVTNFFTMLLAFIGALLVDHLPMIPKNSVFVITSGIISPVLAITYLWLRTGYVPRILSSDTTPYALAGIIVIWLFLAISYLFYGPNDLIFKKYVSTQGAYKYLGLFSLVIWAPITEETIFRGYFLGILMKSYGKIISLTISALLFIALHVNLASPTVTIEWFVSLFVYSLVVGVVYIQAGLASAVMVHMFSNFYYCFYLSQ